MLHRRSKPLTKAAQDRKSPLMAKEAPIECSIITPERLVLNTPATAVVFPAHDGMVGILKDRAPLLCELGTGVLRVDVPDGQTKNVFIDAGFAQVLDNQVTILTERAELAENISRTESQKALSDAEAMPAHDVNSVTDRNKAIDRAKARLSIARQ